MLYVHAHESSDLFDLATALVKFFLPGSFGSPELDALVLEEIEAERKAISCPADCVCQELQPEQEVRFRRLDRSWVRDHAGQITSGGYQLSVHVTGPQDMSPNHSTYRTGYDSRCGWCYLGANHSAAAHDERIA